MSAESNYQHYKFKSVTPIRAAEAPNYIFTHHYTEDAVGFTTIGNFAQLIKVKGVGRFAELALLPGFNKDGSRYTGANHYVLPIAAVNASDFVFAGT